MCKNLFVLLLSLSAFSNLSFAMEEVVASKDSNHLEEIYFDTLKMWQGENIDELQDYYLSAISKWSMHDKSPIIHIEICLIRLAAFNRFNYLDAFIFNNVRENLLIYENELKKLLSVKSFSSIVEKFDSVATLLEIDPDLEVLVVLNYDFAKYKIAEMLYDVFVEIKAYQLKKKTENDSKLNILERHIWDSICSSIRHMMYCYSGNKSALAQSHLKLLELRLANLANFAPIIKNTLLDKELWVAKENFVSLGKPLSLENAILVIAALVDRFESKSDKQIAAGLSIRLSNKDTISFSGLSKIVSSFVIANKYTLLERYFDLMASLLNSKRSDEKLLWNKLIYTHFCDLLKNIGLYQDKDSANHAIRVIHAMHELPIFKSALAEEVLCNEFGRDLLSSLTTSLPNIAMYLDDSNKLHLTEILSCLIKKIGAAQKERDSSVQVVEYNSARVYHLISALAYSAHDYDRALDYSLSGQKKLSELAPTTKGLRNHGKRGRARHQGRGASSSRIANSIVIMHDHKDLYLNALILLEGAAAIRLESENSKKSALIKIGNMREILDESLFVLLEALLTDRYDEISDFLSTHRFKIAKSRGLLLDLAFFAIEKAKNEDEELLLFRAILENMTHLAEQPEPVKMSKQKKLHVRSKADLLASRAQFRQANIADAGKERDRSKEKSVGATYPTDSALDVEERNDDSSQTTLNLKSEYRHQELTKKQKRLLESGSGITEPQHEKQEALLVDDESNFAAFSDDIKEKLLNNKVVQKILRNEKKGIFTGELIQIMHLAASDIRTGNGSHTVAQLTHEKPLVFAHHKEAKKYQINMVKDWLAKHGVKTDG